MNRFRPLDLAVFFAVIFFAMLSLRRPPQKGGRIRVQANGKKYEYSASKDGTYSVDGVLGKTFFEVRNGKVFITDSPCASKLCVRQGSRSPLACLPNDVIITVEDGGGFDAVSE